MPCAYDAYCLALHFKQRPLFDVRFDVPRGWHVEGALYRLGQRSQGRCERRRKHGALVVGDVKKVVDTSHTGVNRGTHGTRRETPAFLVAPGDKLERADRRYAGLVDCFERFKPGKHAKDAIEAPTAWLAVHVAARKHGRGIGIATGTPHEEISDAVDGNREVARARPGHEQATRADVFSRKSGAVDAVAGNSADLRHFHMAPPEALLVYACNRIEVLFSHLACVPGSMFTRR